MEQTQHEFLVEIEELVEHIFADLDELRVTRTEGRSRRELIDRIFRRVHSVKGSAASCGLDVVSHIAHEFENLLDEVRRGRVLIDDDLVDTCESAADALSESLSLAASSTVEPSPRALVDRLQAAARKTTEPQGTAETILKNIPFEIWESLTEPEKHRLVSVVAEGSPLFVVTTSFDIESFDFQFFQLKVKLAELGEVISTSPAVDDEHPDRINFRVLYASSVSAQTIEAAVAGFSNVVFNEIDHAGERDEVLSPTSPALASLLSLSNFVRTDLDKLDQLISSTHELMRTTSTALELALAQPLTNPAELRQLNEQIRSSFRGVENELINLRMVAVGPALQRAVRAGRAAARLAAKEIDFEISGAELRLDKLLVEAITDPLIHLVRNAVDHGIETAEERAQAGKKPRGTVRIEAVSEGSQSRLRVTDDGRGVDPLLISEAALRLGIMQTDDGALDIDRSLRMIFRPGFTTLTSASDLSGRGVGLDVVETAVEQVGGELRVSSEFGGGTTFEIRLPVTFGLLAATVFVSGANHYCIPASQVVAVDAPHSTNAGPADFTLVSMRKLLGQPREGQSTGDLGKQLRVITCEFPDESSEIGSSEIKHIGLLVDAAEPTEEVLVRGLGRHAGRWTSVAGATELRDGTVALVLDLPRLIGE